MARISFASSLQRHVACPDRDVDAATVREALEAVFEDVPTIRGYVLDDRGALRPHVAIFVDGRNVDDLTGLADPVRPEARIHVIQALSGG